MSFKASWHFIIFFHPAFLTQPCDPQAPPLHGADLFTFLVTPPTCCSSLSFYSRAFHCLKCPSHLLHPVESMHLSRTSSSSPSSMNYSPWLHPARPDQTECCLHLMFWSWLRNVIAWLYTILHPVITSAFQFYSQEYCKLLDRGDCAIYFFYSPRGAQYSSRQALDKYLLN